MPLECLLRRYPMGTGTLASVTSVGETAGGRLGTVGSVGETRSGGEKSFSSGMIRSILLTVFCISYIMRCKSQIYIFLVTTKA